jgi:hypothetical protein
LAAVTQYYATIQALGAPSCHGERMGFQFLANAMNSVEII